MKEYKMTLPNGMTVVIEAENLDEAQERFNNNFPLIDNYTIEV